MPLKQLEPSMGGPANMTMTATSPAVCVRPLVDNDGRQVYLGNVTNDDGAVLQLAIKGWEPERLIGATQQVFNESRARMSSLASSQHVVLPLHLSLSREGGMMMVYPYAGCSMDTVCAALRTSGQKAQLLTQLAEMATSVVLTLQKLQAQKPKPFVHRDIKLENLLLGDDGLVRVADFGSMCEQGDSSTAHDPTYFPPDWAALLPDGRHVCEDPARLAAANTVLLDLRGLGMALIQGYAGRLPAEVTLEDADSFSTDSSAWGVGSSTVGGSTGTLGMGSVASSPCSSPRCAPCSGSAVQFDAQETARLLRIAVHDWRTSIDALIPDAPALNQFAKLLMGPKQDIPALSKLLQQPLIKAVHRQVLDTARKARKPWLAHVAACRAAAWQVVAPLMQLEQQLLQVYSDGSLSSMPPLSEQLELLAEQHQEQQSSAAAASAEADTGASTSAEGLQAAVGGVLAQLSAARPEAAARIAQLQQELMQIVAGTDAAGAGKLVADGMPCQQQARQQLCLAATGCSVAAAEAYGLFSNGSGVLPAEDGNNAAGQAGARASFDWNNSAAVDFSQCAEANSNKGVSVQQWGLFAAASTGGPEPALAHVAAAGVGHARDSDAELAAAPQQLLLAAHGTNSSMAAGQAAAARSAVLAVAGAGPCAEATGAEQGEALVAAAAALQQAVALLQQQKLGAQGGNDVVGLLAQAQAALVHAQVQQSSAAWAGPGFVGFGAAGLGCSGAWAHAGSDVQAASRPDSRVSSRAGSMRDYGLVSDSEDLADVESFLTEPAAAAACAPAAGCDGLSTGAWAMRQASGIPRKGYRAGRGGMSVGLARWVLVAAALVSVLQQHHVVKRF